MVLNTSLWKSLSLPRNWASASVVIAKILKEKISTAKSYPFKLIPMEVTIKWNLHHHSFVWVLKPASLYLIDHMQLYPPTIFHFYRYKVVFHYDHLCFSENYYTFFFMVPMVNPKTERRNLRIRAITFYY